MSDIEQTKQTEAGVIPEQWDYVKLGDFAKLYQPKTISGRDLKKSGFPVYGANGIIGFFDRSNHETDQVTITCRGSTCGTINLSKAPCWITGNAMVANVDGNKRIDKSFFYHLLRGQDFGDCVTGSGQPQIVRGPLAAFPLAMPPVDEQKAIAQSLSDIDDLIASLDALIAKKRDIKQGAMQQLLTGKRRLPGFSGEWASGQIKDVADLDPTNLGASTPADWLFDYVSLEDVSQGALLGHTEMAFADAPSRARRVIGRGDILFGTVRPNLKSHCIFDLDGTRWVASTGFCVVRCRAGKSNTDYIFEQIMSQQVDEQIERIIAGSNYPAVSSRDVGALLIALPDIEEQKAIARVLNDMNDEIIGLLLQKTKLDTLRQGVMQQLLTGRIRLI